MAREGLTDAACKRSALKFRVTFDEFDVKLSGAPYLLGDANLDGSVNATDLNALGQNWRGHPNAWQSGDFTADGTVDASDLNALGQNWRASIPIAAAQTTAVPEPATHVVLVLFGTLMFALKSRKHDTRFRI